MKVTKMWYNDDGVLIPGVLIQRVLRKPVFFSTDPSCGWDRQSITKAERKNLVGTLLRGRGNGKSFAAHVDAFDVTIARLEAQTVQLKQLRNEYLTR